MTYELQNRRSRVRALVPLPLYHENFWCFLTSLAFFANATGAG